MLEDERRKDLQLRGSPKLTQDQRDVAERGNQGTNPDIPLNERRKTNLEEKEIESVWCASCQKSMKLVSFPNGVQNWYECDHSKHAVVIYLSESERRIGREEFAKELKEKIDRKQTEIFTFLYESSSELTEDQLSGYSGEQQVFDWVLKLLQESEKE